MSTKLLIGFVILIGSCSILTASGRSSLMNIAINWDHITALNFRGIPNESQIGEATYTLKTTKLKSIAIQITGTKFTNGDNCLDTTYQSGNCQTWYKAGEPFVVTVIPGQHRVRYRVVSGPRISSQNAGAYNAKLSIKVLTE